MTEMNLKPCPFCGGEANFPDLTPYPESRIECTKCGARTRFFSEGEENAALLWNTRQAEDGKVNHEPTSYSCRACKNATDNELARARLALAIEALKFYADSHNHQWLCDSKVSAIDEDCGECAQKVLKEIENDKI